VRRRVHDLNLHALRPHQGHAALDGAAGRYALALVLLLSIGWVSWIALIFPLWVLLISVYILIENYRGKCEAAALGQTGDKA
jgi:hypothetical protein